MRRFLTVFAALTATWFLSGCMALVLAPVANAITDRPTTAEYTTSAKKVPVFNAALKAVTSRGTATTVDRETGMIRGDISVTMGQAAYNVVLNVEEQTGRTVIRVQAKLEGILKFDLKTSADFANEIVQDIERQIGTKLTRV